MAEEKDTEFKFRIDERSPDEELRGDARPSRRTKPPRKGGNILPLSFTFLLTVLCVLGYLDLRKRLTIDQTFDAQSVSGLARQVESKIEELGSRTSELQETLQQDISSNKKSIDSLNFRLHKADYRIKKISETMVDKKTQQEDHQALMTRMEQMSTQVNSLNDNFGQKLDDITGSVKSSRIDLTKVKADMAAKADQRDLEKKMTAEREQRRQALQTFERDMAERINRLQQELARTRKMIQSLEAEQQRLQSRQKAAPPTTPPDNSPPADPQPSEGIIEKDL